MFVLNIMKIEPRTYCASAKDWGGIFPQAAMITRDEVTTSLAYRLGIIPMRKVRWVQWQPLGTNSFLGKLKNIGEGQADAEIPKKQSLTALKN